mmetsp:Transcript_3195/g.8018  ORF Transcript_3195/g.8018 Transcript_3195/m.8018 type:complete len:245 (+) Transcript_3195:320-1054(+)
MLLSARTSAVSSSSVSPACSPDKPTNVSLSLSCTANAAAAAFLRTLTFTELKLSVAPSVRFSALPVGKRAATKLRGCSEILPCSSSQQQNTALQPSGSQSGNSPPADRTSKMALASLEAADLPKLRKVALSSKGAPASPVHALKCLNLVRWPFAGASRPKPMTQGQPLPSPPFSASVRKASMDLFRTSPKVLVSRTQIVALCSSQVFFCCSSCDKRPSSCSATYCRNIAWEAVGANTVTSLNSL